MAPEQVADNVVVSMQYRLSLDNGDLVEESTADEPLVYLHGHQNIIVGLEQALEGMTVGESKTVVVEPEPEDPTTTSRRRKVGTSSAGAAKSVVVLRFDEERIRSL